MRLALPIALAFALPALAAEDLGPTLSKIKESGIVAVAAVAVFVALTSKGGGGGSKAAPAAKAAPGAAAKAAPAAAPAAKAAAPAASGAVATAKAKAAHEEKKLNIKITSAKDHGESFLILESGRAAAFMLDDVLLYGELAKARRRDDWIVTGTPQSREAYGCSMRKGDAKFKALVDRTVARIETSGEAEKIYAKWFLNPIPPRNLNLNFPLSEEMKALFKSPNDKALE
ncbi:MAG: transporter substrate-binding domain-containing protein [Deltaproteobacteria bacterium]|nr:MAG: transporter substrate-binding domain-containing protein [Deltaproteobacteria bacterium]